MKKTISIKNVPTELWWSIKLKATEKKMSIQDFVVAILKREIEK